jgi:dienelactone hydrolase
MENRFLVSFLAAVSVLIIGAALAQTESSVTIPGSQYDSPGILTLPASDRAAPALMLIHGFASDKQEVGGFYERLATDLSNEGIASLRFDFPGSGEHTVGFESNSFDTMLRDAREAFDWLAQQDGVDAERLGLVGFSLGGAIASSIAGSDDRVKALVLWSAAGNLASSQNDLYEQYYQQAVEQGSVNVDLGFRTVDLSPAYFESRFANFPLHEIRNYTGPLLIIHGEEDTSVPLSTAREYLQNAGSRDISLRVLPGADHIFNVLTDNQEDAEHVIDVTVEWADEHLN